MEKFVNTVTEDVVESFNHDLIAFSERSFRGFMLKSILENRPIMTNSVVRELVWFMKNSTPEERAEAERLAIIYAQIHEVCVETAGEVPQLEFDRAQPIDTIILRE